MNSNKLKWQLIVGPRQRKKYQECCKQTAFSIPQFNSFAVQTMRNFFVVWSRCFCVSVGRNPMEPKTVFLVCTFAGLHFRVNEYLIHYNFKCLRVASRNCAAPHLETQRCISKQNIENKVAATFQFSPAVCLAWNFILEPIASLVSFAFFSVFFGAMNFFLFDVRLKNHKKSGAANRW